MNERVRTGEVYPYIGDVQAVMDGEIRTALEHTLSELPPEYRVVFTMRDVDGLTNAEVADVLDISIPAVKSRLHRSRLYLRNRLSRVFRERNREESPVRREGPTS